MDTAAEQRQDLKEAMTTVLAEARTVLPGIQALFGFQTVAVFNERFDALAPAAARAHLLALALVVAAIALIMTPAAYHRIAAPQAVTAPMLALASRLIGWAMLALACALPCDLFTVLSLAGWADGAAGAAAAAAWCALAGLWFALPWRARRRRRAAGRC